MMDARTLQARLRREMAGGPSSGAQTSPTKRHATFRQGIDAVAKVIATYNNDMEASRLFSALTLSSGRDFPLKKALGAIPISRLDGKADSLLSAMANLGFLVTSRTPAWLAKTEKQLPVLVCGKRGLAALVPSDDNWLAITPRGNVRSVSREELADLDAQVWSFEFDSDHNPVSATSRGHTGHSWVRAIFSRFKGVMRSLLIVSALLSLTSIAMPLFIAAFFGQVIGLGDLARMPDLILGLALLTLLDAYFLQRRAEIISYAANRLEFLISTSAFWKILQVSPALSERALPTGQAARLRSFESVRDFITGPAFASVIDLPVSITGLLLVGLLAPQIIIIPLVAVACFATIFLLSLRKSSVLTSIAADAATESQRLAIETLEKLQTIRDNGLQGAWAKRIGVAAKREQRSQMNLRLVGLRAELASTFTFTVSIIGVLAGGAHLVWSGEIGGSVLLAITILTLRSLLPFHTICLTVQRFEQIRRNLKQTNSLMDLAAESEEDRESHHIAPVRGRLSLVNVGFKASDTRPVFVGLDMEIRPGETIGIHGANGTGKSTILKLILGMQNVPLGTIRLDGVDLRQLPLTELRRRISYVPQRPRLFPGTVRQNLAFANPMATEDQMRHILERVSLSQTIAELPDGLDQPIHARIEANFNNDFRYRFAFAQALLVNSRLVLIDELPNSLMNGETGLLLQRLLREMHGKRTVLFVSHRSDFLAEADRIIALRYGKIPIVSKPDGKMVRSA